MSSPYSGGATSVGGQTAAGATGVGGNYAVAPESPPVSGDLGTPMTADGHPDVEGTSVGQLIGEVTKDLSTLMRQELDLAKAELKVEAKKAGQGAGMFGLAGFAGYMVALFVSFALWWFLENFMDAGLAALIVAVLWGIVAAVGFFQGKKKFQQVNPKPERTVETLQQVPGALKPNS